jgi:exopolysaccharide production protein ExoQ
MPPQIALLATLAFIFFLFVWDSRGKEPVNGALWIPVMWMTITGSRFVSQWFNIGSSFDSGGEGSPVDAAYFLLLMLGAATVLLHRRVALGALIRENGWLLAFVLYGLITILWSEFPFVAFKRWIKTLGHPLMALIILTDANPVTAFRVVMKRCAFMLLPFSVMLLKYFPEIGRAFDAYSGAPANNGVGLTKNDLGYLCMIFGNFFAWNLMVATKLPQGQRRREVILSVGFLLMGLWLLQKAQSATAYATLTLGLLTLYLGGRRIVQQHLPGMLVLAVAVLMVSELAFDLYSNVLEVLGRDASLTDRTHLWGDVIALQDKPVFGLGFESFWLGERAAVLSSEWWWHPNQAHNGYIETYLNLGYVGVFLLAGVIVSTFRKVNRQLSADFPFARLRLAFLVSIIAFNYTEAGFKGVHLVWTIFYIIALTYESPEAARLQAAEEDRRRTRIAGQPGKRPAHAMHGGSS